MLLLMVSIDFFERRVRVRGAYAIVKRNTLQVNPKMANIESLSQTKLSPFSNAKVYQFQSCIETRRKREHQTSCAQPPSLVPRSLRLRAAEHNHPRKYPPPPPPSLLKPLSGAAIKGRNPTTSEKTLRSTRQGVERLCAHTDPAGEAALETPSRVKTVVVSWLNIFASCVRTHRDRAGLFRAPIQTNPYEPITPRFHRTSPRVHAG